MIIIEEPYFLAVCVPIKIDRNGLRWCDELWAKDLALHLEYLTDLTLACPRLFAEPASSDRPLNVAPFDRVKFIELPASNGYLAALSNLPELISKMWAGIRSSRIVHAGFGGWPVSEGWFAIPMGKLQGKFVISNVESSFWRVSTTDAKWQKKMLGYLQERLNRYCVRIADVRLFTSKAYETDFLGPGDHTTRHSYVTPAAWIDEHNILSDEDAASDWDNKTGDVRLLFAGRLVAEKGVKVLIDAIEKTHSGSSLEISIIGEGQLYEDCVQLSRQNDNPSMKVKLLSPVPYGSSFFELVRRFDAVLVPSISDEQPRLIFDAFSQALPVLGSGTGGIIEVIDDGVNGVIYKSGDASALAETLRWAGENRNALRTMGLAALDKSRRFSHRSMHEKRSEIISAERSASSRNP